MKRQMQIGKIIIYLFGFGLFGFGLWTTLSDTQNLLLSPGSVIGNYYWWHLGLSLRQPCAKQLTCCIITPAKLERLEGVPGFTQHGKSNWLMPKWTEP